MRSANPALNPQLFAREAQAAGRVEETMTVQGTVNKTALLFLCLLVPAAWLWGRHAAYLPLPTGPGADTAAAALLRSVMPWMWGGLLGGFVLAMITIFAKRAAAVTAPLYAVAEGLFLAAISMVFEAQFPGIVMQAVGLTFGVFFVMLGIYKSGLIRVTNRFRMVIVAATGGIALLYFLSIVLGFFGVTLPLIHSSGPLGIGFSLLVVGIAAFNLMLDFDFIEQGARAGAPRYMEWYGAFGLLVTLVWLYLELLRLLAKLNRRN